jgi:hypothetical protein
VWPTVDTNWANLAAEAAAEEEHDVAPSSGHDTSRLGERASAAMPRPARAHDAWTALPGSACPHVEILHLMHALVVGRLCADLRARNTHAPGRGHCGQSFDGCGRKGAALVSRQVGRREYRGLFQWNDPEPQRRGAERAPGLRFLGACVLRIDYQQPAPRAALRKNVDLGDGMHNTISRIGRNPACRRHSNQNSA